ncbi:MAG TPA: translation initiation factor IF-2 N-terminal domain-containing protein, partial [Pyrinomonadaceae bacterium]
MSVIGNKVRVYDLAREVKQDTKRIIEELRREGADVDVPSNSVSKELAEKIRNKYFPKIEAAPKRLIKVIKKKTSDSPHGEDPAIHETAEPVFVSASEAEEVGEIFVPQADEASKPEANKIKVLTPKVLRPRVEEPEIVEEEPAPVLAAEEFAPAEAVIEVPEEITEVEETAPPLVVEEVKAAAEVEEEEEEIAPPVIERVEPKPTGPKIFTPGTNVKQLTLRQGALDKGIKVGDRLVPATPTKTGKLSDEHKKEQERQRESERGRRDGRRVDNRPGMAGRGKPEFRGTQGESATPMTVYTPPSDNRRKQGRSSGKKGDKTFENRQGGGRFDEKEFNVPRPKSI